MNESSGNSEFDAVLADYLQRVEAGESIDRRSFLTRHPQFAKELEQFIEEDFRWKRLAGAHSADESGFEPTIDSQSPVEQPTPIQTQIGYFGDYQLIEEIARGGMGVVYKARQVNLNRVVALKMILAGQLASKQDVLRFYQEAEAAANLNHPGIVPIFEVGQHEGQHFFSMGFVDGHSLAKRVGEGPLQPRDAAELLLKVAEAVEFAHRRGVVHRDLKPANILLDANDEPLVTDFGLAKKTEADSELTSTGQILGTPGYMPPEQAAGATEKIGPLADVYSLGAILYCVLTGRPPFQAANVLDTLMQVLEQEPVAPRQLNPQVPRDLETICLKCLQKDQQRRYESAQALADDLGRWLENKPILARPVGRAERTVKLVRRHPVVAGLSLAVVLALVSGIVVSSIFAIRAKQSADLERIARGDAEAKRQLAESNEQLAVREGQRAERNAVAERQARQVAQRNLYLADMRLAQEAWQTGYLLRLRELLDRHVPQPGQADLRGWEWWLMNTAWQRLSLVLDGGRWCAAVAWSPDDRFLATGNVSPSYGAHVQIWDAATGQRVHELATGTVGVFGIAWSPDGERLATAVSDGSVILWQASDGVELRRWQAHRGPSSVRNWFPCMSVDWHPEGGQIASAGRDGMVRIWNPETGAQIHEFTGHSSDVNCIAWSPDGRQLASGGRDHSVRIWDLSVLDEPNRGKSSTATAVPVQGHEDRVWCVAWSPDSQRLASASDDGSVGVWNAKTGQRELNLRQERDTRGLWAWKGSTEIPLVGLGHDSFVNAVAWSPDGERIISGGEDQTVRVWDSTSGRELETLRPHRGGVETLAFNHDGTRLASGGKEGSIAVFDMQRDSAAFILSESVGEVTRVCWSPDGSQLLTGHHDRWIEPHFVALLWRGDQPGIVKRFPPLSLPPIPLGWSRLGNQLLWPESASKLTFTDPESGTKVGGFEATNKKTIVAVSNDPSGSKLAIAADDEIYVMDAASGEVLTQFRPHSAAIRDLNWSPDGHWIAAGSSDSNITISDSVSGQLRWRLSGHSDGVGSVTWSVDGQRLASGGDDRTIRIWDVQTGEQLRSLRGHSQMVSNVRWHPDGNRLASADFDGTIKLWDTDLWREVLSLRAHVGGVNSLQWSPDGRRLASGSSDHTVTVWQAAGIDAAKSERRDHPMLQLAWHVLGLGGSLDLGDEVVSNLASLPQGEFAIFGISFPPGTALTSRDVANLKAASELTSLDLRHTAVNDQAVEPLTAFTRLRDIDLTETLVSQTAVNKLRAALPEAEIRWEEFLADRLAAEKILALGASITMRMADDTVTVSAASQLPEHPFRVVGIQWKNQSNVQDEDLAALADLTEVETLDLFGLNITDEGLKHLQHLSKLKSLDISRTQVTGSGLAYLQSLSELNRLVCEYRLPFTDEGLSYLPPLPSLKKWRGNLQTPVTDNALVYFQRWQSLEIMYIWRSDLTGAGLEHLSKLPYLNDLVIRSDNLQNEQLKHLKDFPALRALNIPAFGGLDRVGVQHIADMPGLERLELKGCSLDDDGLLILSQSKFLAELNVEGTSVSVAGITAFKERKPNCKVAWDESQAIQRAANEARLKVTRELLEKEPLHPHEVRRFWGHTGSIKCIAVSPDGKTAASVGGWPQGDGTLRLWNLQTGELLHTLSAARMYAMAVAFTPNGQRVISGGEQQVRVWDVETGELLREFQTNGKTSGIAALADSQRIVIGDVAGVSQWNIDTGELLRTYGGITTGGRQLDVSLSGDGRRLISGDERNAVHVWDLETGDQLLHLTDLSAAVESAALDSDGSHAAFATRQGELVIYSLKTLTRSLSFAGHTERINSVRYSPNGTRLATAGHDGLIRIWNAETGESIATLTGHANIVWSAVYTPDGQSILAGGGGLVIDGKMQAGEDHALRLWKVSDDGHAAAPTPESPKQSPEDESVDVKATAESVEPTQVSAAPRSFTELPSDHLIAILQHERYQAQIGLTGIDREFVKPIIAQYLKDLGQPDRKVSATELADRFAKPIRDSLNDDQQRELARLERSIKFTSPTVTHLSVNWIQHELELTNEQLQKLADLQSESLLRIYTIPKADGDAKVEAEVDQALARERQLLTDDQQSRFDQIYLQQQVWLHGPGLFASDIAQIQPLEITTAQQEALATFVSKWRANLPSAKQLGSIEALIDHRQAGVDDALQLLTPQQRERWKELLGETIDWRNQWPVVRENDE
ncbi:WD40 domain-containing protein [Aporhodopirellula aestuarii]|uniref:Protein kinase n=1 Tax=Aporhodopirellula aestuarii TaxID=2950107 RepID=A0ABT0U4M1_9BACT|nr:protein kinase [Aporhodopirellula aestuarii]MCM2371887.1 protein kinase [Aporhodopirellula aestuarii]